MSGTKHDQGKPDWSYLPSHVIEEVLKVYAMGAEKYGRGNYKKGILYSRIFSAAMRHLWAWWRGEWLDKESQLPHLAHAAWNVITLLEYALDPPDHAAFDDRVTQAKSAEDVEKKELGEAVRRRYAKVVSLNTEVERMQVALGKEHSEVERLTAELEEYKRLYEFRGKVLLRPCIKCGYASKTITPAVEKIIGDRVGISSTTIPLEEAE